HQGRSRAHRARLSGVPRQEGAVLAKGQGRRTPRALKPDRRAEGRGRRCARQDPQVEVTFGPQIRAQRRVVSAASVCDDWSRSSQDWMSMHRVVAKSQLSPNVTRLVIEAARIAEIRRPGQFVIVRLAEGAERLPLTIADADPGAGTISLIIQAVGKSTIDLVELAVGGAIQDVAGPLGRPTDLI